MAINKKLITFDKKSTFLGANGINNVSSPTDGYYHNIPEWSMVFILETGEIWHNGKYFGRPIKDQIFPATSQLTKGIVFMNNDDYYYRSFNLWGNVFNGSVRDINGELVVQGETYKWTYGDSVIRKGNTNLIAFSGLSGVYDVFIPSGDLSVTGGDLKIGNNITLASTGSIKGTHILNTNSYFNLDYSLGKTWNSIKLFNTSGTLISLDSTRPAIINIQAGVYASGTNWQPWITGGDVTELSSWGIGLGGDAFYIGRISKSNTENSLSQYWKFDSEDGITISGTTKYIKVADLAGASEKIFMADGTVKALSDIASESLIGEATTTNYGGFKLTQNKSSVQQTLVSNTTGNGRYAVKMNADGTLFVEFVLANTWLPATNSQEGYVPQLSGSNDAISSSLNDYVLTFTSSDAETITPTWRRLPSNAFDNTWRSIYVDNISKLGTGTTTKPINFKSGSGITLTFTAAGDNAYNTLQIDGTTYSTATDSTLGLVKVGTTLDNVTGFTAVHIKDGVIYYKDTTYSFSNLKFQLTSGTDLMTYNSLATKTILAGTGITFSYLNNVLTISSDVYSTATSSILGLVKVGTTLEDTTGYTKVHIDDSGFIYYHDTTYSFSKLKFQQTSGTDLMTYDSQAVRTILAGDNITFTHSSNVLTIKATDTWTKFVGATDSSNGTAGYIDAPGKSNKNNFLRGDGTWLSLESNVTSALYVGASNGTSTAAQSTNGSVYLIFKEGSSYSRYKISGSGRASVTSDVSGNITINSSGYSNFGAATASAAGSAGLVPAPGANVLGSSGYYLRADGSWAVPTNTWNAANNSQAGYVPKLTTGGGTIATQSTEYVLTFTSGGTGTITPTWKLLPTNAFANTWNLGSDLLAGYVPKATKDYFLHCNNSTGVLEWVANPNTNTWRGIYVGGASKVGTGTNTLPINFVAGSNVSITYEAAGTGSGQSGSAGYFNIKISATDTKYSDFVKSGSNAAHGLVPKPSTTAGTTHYLREDGTWAVPPNDNTWKAANSSQEGYVPKSTASKILRSDANGALYWGDDSNTWKEVTTSLEGYVPKIVTTGSLAATDSPFILVFKNVSGSTKTAWVPLPANAFKNDNTWIPWKGATDSANGTAGYMPAPTSAQRGQFLRGDGSWVSLNNYSLPTASKDTLGGVKTGAAITDTTGYTAVAIKNGVIYYKDTNTTYSFSNLLFQQKSGTNLMTYNSQAVRTVLAGSNITFTHSNNVLTIAAKDTTYGTVSKTAAGLCPILPNETTTTKYLRLDGTWLTPPDNNTWKAANASQEGYVPKSTANKILRANGDGNLYWGDDANTTYTFYNLQFQNSSGTTVDTYKPTTSLTKTLKAGSNVTISAASNIITIASTNTWNANAVGVAGYVAAPTKAANANMVWKTDSDGNPAWRADSNTHYYLTLNGTVKGTASSTNLGTIWAPTSKGTGFLKCNDGTWSYDNTTYATPDTKTTLSRASGNLTKDTWSDVGTFADTVAEGTWVISFTIDGSLYSGVFSRKKNDTMNEEIDLHASGTSTRRIYARTTGNKIQIATSDATFNPGAVTFNFRKLI